MDWAIGKWGGGQERKREEEDKREGKTGDRRPRGCRLHKYEKQGGAEEKFRAGDR